MIPALDEKNNFIYSNNRWRYLYGEQATLQNIKNHLLLQPKDSLLHKGNNYQAYLSRNQSNELVSMLEGVVNSTPNVGYTVTTTSFRGGTLSIQFDVKL